MSLNSNSNSNSNNFMTNKAGVSFADLGVDIVAVHEALGWLLANGHMTAEEVDAHMTKLMAPKTMEEIKACMPHDAAPASAGSSSSQAQTAYSPGSAPVSAGFNVAQGKCKGKGHGKGKGKNNSKAKTKTNAVTQQ